MSEDPKPCDVVIVGLGATGSIAAMELGAAGADVVALDAGPWHSPSEMTLDEVRNNVLNWLDTRGAVEASPTWRTSRDEAAGPAPRTPVMMRAIGGATVHYEGVSPRFSTWNFNSRSEATRRYGANAIPSNSTLADWPVSYGDLEPYFEQVEQELGVSGARGEFADGLRAGTDPFEGPSNREYPMPPLRRTGFTDLTATAARRLGWHPFAAPAALNSVPFRGRAACTYCGFCTGNGCYVDAKSSSDRTFVPIAVRSGNVRIESEARVLEIMVGHDGLVTGVRYVKDGTERFQAAKVVLVGTFPYENTRLLLTSASPAFPNGLANNSDQVGRHYIAHVTPGVYGLFPDKDLKLFSGTWAQSTCVNDWNADNFDHSGLGFLSGGMMSAFHELKPIAFVRSAVPPEVPRWGNVWKRWLRENARSVGCASAQIDALSYEENVIDLDPEARDSYGVPLPRVTHRLFPNEERAHDFLRDKLDLWLREAGATEVWSGDDYRYEPRHAYGGTRMGDDPSTSVTDGWCFAHEVPNLGIMGASNFPTAGGVNPTLTAQALTWRMVEHLVADWSAIAPA